MQLLLLLLVVGIFVHDELGPASPRLDSGWSLLWLALGIRLALGGFYAWACHRTRLRLSTPKARRSMHRLEQLGVVVRYTAVALYGLDLYAGSLTALRALLSDAPRGWVLIDEALFMLPTLALLVWGWWAYFPIDRRLREASLMSRLDAGLPIQAVWTRRQFLLAQLRHQVALILAPLLAMIGWEELVTRWEPGHRQWMGVPLQGALALAGIGAIFLFTPVAMRYLWDTAPLPRGDLRDRLMSMCRQYRVGVRELLLWRTFGGMINGAVMGIVGPVRYILLTDALLDCLPTPQVEAVMAHELAHVRKHHMLWLMLTAVGLKMSLAAGWWSILRIVMASLDAAAPTAWRGEITMLLAHDDIRIALLLALTVACWVPAFGWVSRRFERQADSFAVQHLARQQASTPSSTDAGHLVVTHAAAATMADALQSVADLNNIIVARHSWRHGSIAWRQSYLRGLVGQHVNRLAIDRQVVWIKLAAAGAILACLLLLKFDGMAML